jgi:hypothetical protein
VLVFLGMSLYLVPLLGSSEVFSNIKIPWILLSIYRGGNLYFGHFPHSNRNLADYDGNRRLEKMIELCHWLVEESISQGAY